MTHLLTAIDAVEATRPALIDDAEALTYGELRDGARRIARTVVECHGRGGFIAVRAAQSVAFVRTLVGIVYSGNTPIPVDPALPADTMAFIERKAGAAATIDPVPSDVVAAATPLDARDDERPVLILFTSGTSGFPKGVVVSQANLAHSCRAMADYLGYAQHPSAAVVLPLYYSYALLSQVLCQLTVGGRVRLVRDLSNPLKLRDVVESQELETFCGVPSTYHALCGFHDLQPITMHSVRVLCSAGAAMDAALTSRIRRVFPNARFFNNYGMTEAAPRIAYIRDDDPRFFEPTCGRPMDGVEVKVVDPVSGRDLGEGESGMLVVRGPNVTAGYLNDPELTAEAFTSDGFLRSGDMASMRQGYIYIEGRYDDVFNTSGEKVAPLEIERVLDRVDGVELSAVAGLPDPVRGRVPVAFLKLKTPMTRRDLLAALAPGLPKSKMPMRFYEVSAFPMTPNGKLQRKRLDPDDRTTVVREIR